ncbi:tRNA (guanosine(46)-N7)-methyltransferase TrmB [Myceligenerans crystallogenes]|uniref:tRNA (guanosine(46)-N7)-methyltransferase TrmB n=1 Tax=Myceligenerans crystallogenes TaxID=316335 RepID=UPI0031D69398
MSFSSRSGRLTDAQQRAWDTRRDAYLVEVPRGVGRMSLDTSWRFDAERVYGRVAPLVLEIGSGQGDAIVAAAGRDPQRDYLAVEVYKPGVAQVMVRADRAAAEAAAGRGAVDDDVAGLPNLRVVQVNAAELLETAVPAGSLDELWTFFPDPWHKSRHKKRRLVTPKFAATAARALRPGGTWRLATDWADYAGQMFDVLDAEPALAGAHGPRTAAPRFEGRIVTGFERKAHRAGREITDLTYTRV